MALFSAIVAGIKAISAWTIGFGALGTFAMGNFLLRAAVQLGVSALAKAFAKRAGSHEAPFAIQGTVRTGGSVPRSFVLGPSLSAGSLVWHSEWGEDGNTPNAYYTQVIALSDIPVAGFKRWFIEGRAVTLEDTGSEKGLAAVEYRENGKDHAWVRFHDGNQLVADEFLTLTVNDAAPRAYSSSRIGKGIAYAVVTFRVNNEIFTGFPRSKFVLDGVKLYDVSKDSTQGGTGLHRWDDPATWGGDGDALPAVQAYNLARGIYYHDPDTGGGAVAPQWFYGLQGLTAARLPAAHWISQIGKCRAQVEGEDGLEPAYRCAGEITVNSEIGSAFEAVLTACAGRMSEVGGVFKIYVGAPDAPVAHFEDEDIVSLAPQTFTPFFGLSETVNGVIASYPSPDEGYVMRSTPPIYNADFEAQDGGRRLMTDVQLSFVPFPAQAQRLLKGELAAARRARRHTHTLPARFRLIEPGDVVTWTSARNGYDAKQFRVDGIIDLPNCDLIADLTEVDPADHGGWDHATDYTPVSPVPLEPVRPTAQGVIGFNPVAYDVQDAAGTARRPGLLMQWNADVDDIAGIRFEVRVKATGAVVSKAETRAFETGDLLIEAGLVAGTEYEVKAKYIPASRRRVSWTSWASVSTNDVRLGKDDFGPGSLEWSALAQGVRDQIDSAGDASLSAQVAADAQAAAEAAASGAQGSDAAAQAAAAAATGAQSAASSSEAAALAAQRASEAAETAAAGSASSAASSASAASASETAAGSSASAAESSRIEASVAGDRSFQFSTGNMLGRSRFAPDAFDPFSASETQVVAVTGHPNGADYALRAIQRNVLSSFNADDLSNRVFRIRGVVDASASPYDAKLGFRVIREAGNSGWHHAPAAQAGEGPQAFDVTLSISEYVNPQGFQFFLQSHGASDALDHQVDWSELHYEDVTESTLSASSASAAAESASAASASETAAGSSASAAESSRLAAEAAEGNAAGSASAAASSASAASASETAAGSSASAAESSRLSAETAEGNAAGSASAAASSASAASASETAAGSSASAAESSRLAAETAEGNAAGSASAAASSASTASASQTAAASSASAAQVSRLAAETAKNSAAGSAAAADVSAADAANSKSDANGARSDAQSARDVAVAIEARQNHAERLTNPGFEAGVEGAAGIPVGWIGGSKSAGSFSGGALSYEGGSRANSGGAFASQLGFGARYADAGAWWWIGKRFRCNPGQEFTAKVAVWMASVTPWATLQAAGTNAVGEDDAWLHFIWYDDEGVKLSENNTWSVNYTLCKGAGADIALKVFHTFAPGTRTAPTGAAYLEIRLVAADADGTASGNMQTYSGFVGNAAVIFDDFELTSSGAIAEVAQSEWEGNLHRVAAGVSETAAAFAQSSAEDAAAGAAFARDVAARVMGGGGNPNPIFVEPVGNPTSVPDAYVWSSGYGSTMERKKSGGKYGSCIEYSTGSALTGSRPLIYQKSSDVDGLKGSDADAVEFDIEIEMISGSWGSARIQIHWESGSGGTDKFVMFYLSDLITSRNGKVQRVKGLAQRPDGFVPGDLDELRVMLYGNVNNSPYGEVDYSARIHRFDYHVVSQSASALIAQKAITDLKGNAEASLVFRAKAGGASGAVEIVAADNAQGGSASKVKLTGDEIEFDGLSVFGNSLQSDDFQAGASGWRIKKGGDAEFNQLIVRQSLVDGAASKGGTRLGQADPVTKSSVGLGTLTLGAFEQGEFWQIAARLKYRVHSYEDKGFTQSPEGDPVYHHDRLFTCPYLQWRIKSGGVWGGWQAIYTFPRGETETWVEHSAVVSKQGVYDDVQIRIYVGLHRQSYSTGHGDMTLTNVHENSMVARALVR